METLQCYLKIFPLGPEGNQTVLRGAAPKDSLITRGTSRGKIFSDKPKAFPLFVRLWGSKTEEDAADGLPEENLEGGFRLSLGTV